MEIIEDPKIFRPLAERAIEQFGHAPEHNLEWFLVNAETSEKSVYIHWPDGTGLMTLKADKEWYTFSEPLAPEEDAGQKISEFSEHVLKQDLTEEVVVESREPVKDILETNNNLKILPTDCTLIWPVVNLNEFKDDLSGSHFKGLRNIRNRFYKDYNLGISDVSAVEMQELYRVVETWAKNRTGDDKVWPQTYLNLTDKKFVGTKSSKAFLVDGRVVGFTAGWEIPNRPGYFYNGVAIHDYSLKDFGLLMYTENILAVKSLGYKYFDLGGVEEGGPLDFKRRFQPEYEYKTFIFSIIKR